MRDPLRGPTPRPVRRDPSGPQSVADDTTRRLESPAEISTVQEIVQVLAAQIGDIVEAKLAATQPASSGDSVSMRRATRTGYRGAIGALAAGLVAAITWGVTEVRAYGDGRESAARSAIAAEAKAADAARFAEDTRKVAETAAARADVLEAKLDKVLAKLDEMERR